MSIWQVKRKLQDEHHTHDVIRVSPANRILEFASSWTTHPQWARHHRKRPLIYCLTVNVCDLIHDPLHDTSLSVSWNHRRLILLASVQSSQANRHRRFTFVLGNLDIMISASRNRLTWGILNDLPSVDAVLFVLCSIAPLAFCMTSGARELWRLLVICSGCKSINAVIGVKFDRQLWNQTIVSWTRWPVHHSSLQNDSNGLIEVSILMEKYVQSRDRDSPSQSYW